ncbi:MAG: hypothetical protein ACWA5A_01265 [Marinibacterium sp.]
MKNRWHILKGPGRYTLARHVPVRLDVSSATSLPIARKDRLARQIRQDMWRALQDVRGFSPVVEVVEDGETLTVTAGGRIDTRPFPRARIEARIADLLADPVRRARWVRWAA